MPSQMLASSQDFFMRGAVRRAACGSATVASELGRGTATRGRLGAEVANQAIGRAVGHGELTPLGAVGLPQHAGGQPQRIEVEQPPLHGDRPQRADGDARMGGDVHLAVVGAEAALEVKQARHVVNRA